MHKNTFHRDGTVTYWSVYHRSWQRNIPAVEIPDRELAAMSENERRRVARLIGNEAES